MIVCVVLDLLLFFEVIFNDLMFRFNNLICMLISMYIRLLNLNIKLLNIILEGSNGFRIVQVIMGCVILVCDRVGQFIDGLNLDIKVRFIIY